MAKVQLLKSDNAAKYRFRQILARNERTLDILLNQRGLNEPERQMFERSWSC